MRVEALKRHPYGPRTYEVGEAYDMEERHVQTMVTLGHVRVVPEVNTRDMQSDKPPKTYKTRDMKTR